MNSWLKEDHVPIWWPPKYDDCYGKEKRWQIKAVYVIVGWFMFALIWGAVIFILMFVYHLVGLI